ncbi:MAG: hypothetical protein ACOC0P_03255 [Planctomycetota bacterium]
MSRTAVRTNRRMTSLSAASLAVAMSGAADLPGVDQLGSGFMMPAAMAQTIIVDDFDDRNLDGWEVIEDEFGPWGGANFTAESGALVMETNEIVPADVPLFTSAGIRKSAVETDDFFFHGTWELDLTLDNDQTAFFQTVRGDTKGASAVGIFAQQATPVAPGFIGIDVYRDGFQVDSQFEIFDVQDNLTYAIEVSAIDDRYQMWIWPKSDPKPDEPQIDLTNDEPMATPALTTFIYTLDELNGRVESRLSATVDNIRFTPDYRIADPGPLSWGGEAVVNIRGAVPGTTQYVIYSLTGEGVTPIPQLGVDAGVLNPQLAGTTQADASGNAAFTRRLPGRSGEAPVWIQSLQQGDTTNVVLTQIN